MNTTVKRIALVAALGLGSAISMEASASAMSAIDPGVVTASGTAATIEEARWVCGPYRCWWRPTPYWAPLHYYGPGWGWHRWHRWHPGWW
ncbi:MAG TPA: hypothetical protein VEK34_09310 [Methylocella sp.]|nr:hypothetical protein [Methylocella sp.]